MPSSTSRSAVWGFLVAAAAISLVTPTGLAQQPLTDKGKGRLEQLERLAQAIDKVQVGRTQSSGDREVEGRRLSSRSELHMRFLTAAATLADNGEDGLCAFPVQVSGFASNITLTKGLSDRKSGADMQRAMITLQGLIGQPRPKANVELPPLNHGSGFPADQIARDRIHDLIRLYFPDAEIDGVQRFFEKEFEVRNDSDETVRVWVYGRTWDKSPDRAEGPELGRTDAEVKDESSELVWLWKPGTPPRAKPFEMIVPPGRSQKVAYEERGASHTLAANRVLVWAESESGEQWLEHQHQPLWLVPPNPQDDNERTYHAKQIETYMFPIKPKPGPRVFTERTLELKNDTSEELRVRLRYRTNRSGTIVWKETDVTLPPQQSLRPRGPDGAQIRASQILFGALGEHRKYTKHVRDPLWLIDEHEGRRVYKADKMGSFIYTFERGAAAESGLARITGSRVPVNANGRTLAYVNSGEQYRVVDSDGEDIKIAFSVRGRESMGWVSRRYARTEPTLAPTAPAVAREALRITANQTEVRVGATAIGQVRRNETYPVLEKKDGWARIEVTVEGIPRHAWVNQRDTQPIAPPEMIGHE